MTKKEQTRKSRRMLAACLMYCLLCPAGLMAQDIGEFREFEDSLVRLSVILYQGASDEVKFQANEVFISMFTDALSLNNSFRYPFDSLKLISILTAPDKKFRIITWMIAKEDGSYIYYGFLQSFSRRKNDYEVYPLTDMSEQMDHPESRVIDHKNWYGAVYYEVILTRYSGNRYYTLLGWDGNSPVVRRKVIEVLTLRSNGMPRFGQSLFRYKDQTNIKRILFEYSSLAAMNLRFEQQHFIEKSERVFYNDRKKPAKRRKTGGIVNRNGAAGKEKSRYRYTRKGDEMIVFDRLVPLNPSLEGQYQFYVPEGNIVDAFRFTSGRWRLVEDIDARNPGHRYDKPKKRPRPERGLVPGR